MSKINNKELLLELSQTCKSRKEMLIKLGLRPAGGNFATLKKYANEFSIELPKMNYSKDPNKPIYRFSNEEIFVENSSYSNRTNIKVKMIEIGFKNECQECGLGNQWNGKTLRLQLDHVNGISNDNRLENLRFLCPNCHSQTETFCGKNKLVDCKCGKKMHYQANMCNDCNDKKHFHLCKCGVKIRKIHNHCKKCNYLIRYNTEDTYPSLEELEASVKTHGYSATGRILGVSDSAVRKRIKRLHELQKDHSKN